MDLKNRIPVITTQIGVSEFNIPHNELSIFFEIASAKRKAGKRLPSKPASIV